MFLKHSSVKKHNTADFRKKNSATTSLQRREPLQESRMVPKFGPDIKSSEEKQEEIELALFTTKILTL